MKRGKNSVKKLKVLGVSAGQGILLYPFRHQLIANVEPRGVFHTKNEEQWRSNFGKIPFIKDGLNPNWAPDVILSSPDCGASSIMRLSKVKQLGNPSSNKSLNLVIEAILMYKPKIFLIENLPRLLTLMPINFFQDTFSDYKIIIHQSSVSEFGNSQTSRKRLMIIGVNKITAKSYINSFDNKIQVHKIKITRRLLFNTPYELNDANIDNLIPPLDKKLAMYDYRKLPKKDNITVKEIQYLWTHDFKYEKKWPIKTAKMSTLPGVYRLLPDRYPLTLRPADRQFRPDGYPLGLMDFKSIMGFPKRFQIYIDNRNQQYWLNKARYTIAKGAVGEIGRWFRRCLFRKEKRK